jgi:hypothetical protein
MIGNIVLGQTTFSYKDDFKKILAQTKDENDNLLHTQKFIKDVVEKTGHSIIDVNFSTRKRFDNFKYKIYSRTDLLQNLVD